MAHYTYIIYSETFDLYYKGETVDFSKRLDDHNAGLSRFTAGKGPWKLVWTKAFANRREALIEEKRLKKLNRRSLEKLIKEYWPVISQSFDETGSSPVRTA